VFHIRVTSSGSSPCSLSSLMMSPRAFGDIIEYDSHLFADLCMYVCAYVCAYVYAYVNADGVHVAAFRRIAEKVGRTAGIMVYCDDCGSVFMYAGTPVRGTFVCINVYQCVRMCINVYTCVYMCTCVSAVVPSGNRLETRA
jgi:hypothetical protein